MGVVNAIKNFRLNIDSEYQGWILMFATLTAVWVYCLPCYCAGMQTQCLRRGAAYVQMRLPYYLLFASFINAVMLFLIITWLPDWAPKDYITCVLKGLLYFAKNLAKSMVSIALIVVAVFVYAFRDRIFKLMGMDHKTVFRFKLRDIFNVGGTSTRAIELQILKVEDLPAAQVFSPNNVFIEVYLGYNEPMKTRVHNNAGSNCIMKETLQLNFDQDEYDDPMYLFVKNQKVMGAGELARLELKAEDVHEVEKECKATSKEWSENNFMKKQLMPRGIIWFRVNAIDDEEAGSYRC